MNWTSASKTVGFQPTLSVCEIDRPSWREVLQWIHEGIGQSEIDGLLSEAHRRFELQRQVSSPLEAIQDRSRVAAAYLLMAPGRVASLGGVRTLPGYTQAGIELVRHLTDLALQYGAQQIQAIVDLEHHDLSHVLYPTGYQHLAMLKHVWLALGERGSEPRHDCSDELRWEAAGDFARSRMARLLAGTFQDTLDCPALNGLRNPENILESFLDGRKHRTLKHWWVAQYRGREAGCLLLSQHPHGVCELAYMGLLPEARNRGLGASLLNHARRQAAAMGNSILVAAVDCENWPAVRLYAKAGFHEHRRLQAWFRVG